MSEWKKARKKPLLVEFREVRGKEEIIVTGDGDLIVHPEKSLIIKDIEGKPYSIDKEIFEKTYQVLPEGEDPRKLQALNWLANFLKTIPLTFQKTISIALLRHKSQTGDHDFMLLLRDESDSFFTTQGNKQLMAMIAPFMQRLEGKIKLEMERVKWKKKVWNCINIDLMPEVKERWNKMMKKAKETKNER